MAINQLKAGAILSYVVLALSNLVSLAYTPYMLRMMGQSEYGLYALVASVIAYLGILDFGFGNAVIRYTAKFRAEGKVEEQYSMFGMFFLLYSAIGVISFIGGLGLYYNVDAMFGKTMTLIELDKARIMMLLMLFNLAFTFQFSVFGSIISAYENFVFQKVIQIIRIVLNTIVMVLLLEMGYRAIGMVVVATVFNVATLLINFWYCKYRLRVKIYFRKFEWKLLKEVSIYSFFIFLNIIMDRIYWSTGQFVLGMYVGTAAVAIFAVAINLQNMYMSFSTSISSVFLPKVTSMIAKEKSEKEVSDLFIRTGRIQYIVLAFILSGFILFGKQFIILWAGPSYVQSYFISLLFFIPLTIPLIQNIGITILQARNQMKFRSLVYILIAVISLVIQVPLAKMYGGIGCGLGIAIGLTIGHIIIMNFYYSKKQSIDIAKFWYEIGKMSISPLILGGLTAFSLNYFNILNVLSLFIGISIYTVIYWVIFWFVGMNLYERNLFKEPVSKLLAFKINNRIQ